MVNFAYVFINRITLLKLLKNIIAIGLLLVFLLSTSGITILTHYCSGSKKTTQRIFSGFKSSESGCGGMSCSVSPKILSFASGESISKASCCKENTAFYKVAAVDNLSAKEFKEIISINDLEIPDNLLFSSVLIETENLCFLQSRSVVPPIAGKLLVVFLQQLRIPSPSCFS